MSLCSNSKNRLFSEMMEKMAKLTAVAPSPSALIPPLCDFSPPRATGRAKGTLQRDTISVWFCPGGIGSGWQFPSSGGWTTRPPSFSHKAKTRTGTDLASRQSFFCSQQLDSSPSHPWWDVENHTEKNQQNHFPWVWSIAAHEERGSIDYAVIMRQETSSHGGGYYGNGEWK